VAAGLRSLFEAPSRSFVDAAQAAGRGERSAVGLHGFSRGGLIVEAGKLRSDEISPLVAHATLPDAWRCVLLCPIDEEGRSGEAERRAFGDLPAVDAAVTAALCQTAILDLVPAARAGNFAAFCDAVHAFGRRAGECFAPVQGGAYATPRLQSLVERLRGMGVAGVGQTSWGPTLFAFAESPGAATDLVATLRSDSAFDGLEITVAQPAAAGHRAVRDSERE
jgi:predicted sugar kinase